VVWEGGNNKKKKGLKSREKALQRARLCGRAFRAKVNSWGEKTGETELHVPVVRKGKKNRVRSLSETAKRVRLSSEKKEGKVQRKKR